MPIEAPHRLAQTPPSRPLYSEVVREPLPAARARAGSLSPPRYLPPAKIERGPVVMGPELAPPGSADGTPRSVLHKLTRALARLALEWRGAKGSALFEDVARRYNTKLTELNVALRQVSRQVRPGSLDINPLLFDLDFYLTAHRDHVSTLLSAAAPLDVANTSLIKFLANGTTEARPAQLRLAVGRLTVFLPTDESSLYQLAHDHPHQSVRQRIQGFYVDIAQLAEQHRVREVHNHFGHNAACRKVALEWGAYAAKLIAPETAPPLRTNSPVDEHLI